MLRWMLLLVQNLHEPKPQIIPTRVQNRKAGFKAVLAATTARVESAVHFFLLDGKFRLNPHCHYGDPSPAQMHHATIRVESYLILTSKVELQ